MVSTYVSLRHADINSGSDIQIFCTGVSVSFNKKNDKTPNTLWDQFPASVQSVGRENTKYTLESSKLGLGDLTYSILLDLINLQNDEGLVLNVKYNDTWLVDSLGTTTDIPVTIDGGTNIKFSTIESNNAYMPVIGIPLVEVKV